MWRKEADCCLEAPICAASGKKNYCYCQLCSKVGHDAFPRLPVEGSANHLCFIPSCSLSIHSPDQVVSLFIASFLFLCDSISSMAQTVLFVADGCIELPTYGWPVWKPETCAAHATAGMEEYVPKKRCGKGLLCSKHSSFGWPGHM